MVGRDSANPQPPGVLGAKLQATARGLEVRFASDPRHVAAVRRAVEAYCASHACDEKAAADIGLCVNEALANIIRHAYLNAPDRPIHVRVDCDGRRVRVTIRDWGNGRNPADLPACEQRDPLTPGGLGLVCLRALMDQVHFEPQPDGMVLVMEKSKT